MGKLNVKPNGRLYVFCFSKKYYSEFRLCARIKGVATWPSHQKLGELTNIMEISLMLAKLKPLLAEFGEIEQHHYTRKHD